MKNDYGVIYEKAQSFRADVFKNLAYFFASLAGFLLVRIFIYKENLLNYSDSKVIIIMTSLIVSLQLIGHSIEILQKLDEKIAEKKYQAQKKESI